MSASTRVFVARLTGLSVFDPLGDQVGRVRDVVVMFSVNRPEPRVIGLVVEVPGRRRVFVPMTRVTSIDAGAVITTGLVNMRRFEQRTNEVLVAAELFDRTVRVTTELHGGIGFTWEYDLHLWFRRAMFDRSVLGSAGLQRARAAVAAGW